MVSPSAFWAGRECKDASKVLHASCFIYIFSASRCSPCHVSKLAASFQSLLLLFCCIRQRQILREIKASTSCFSKADMPRRTVKDSSVKISSPAVDDRALIIWVQSNSFLMLQYSGAFGRSFKLRGMTVQTAEKLRREIKADCALGEGGLSMYTISNPAGL